MSGARVDTAHSEQALPIVETFLRRRAGALSSGWPRSRSRDAGPVLMTTRLQSVQTSSSISPRPLGASASLQLPCALVLMLPSAARVIGLAPHAGIHAAGARGIRGVMIDHTLLKPDAHSKTSRPMPRGANRVRQRCVIQPGWPTGPLRRQSIVKVCSWSLSAWATTAHETLETRVRSLTARARFDMVVNVGLSNRETCGSSNAIRRHRPCREAVA